MTTLHLDPRDPMDYLVSLGLGLVLPASTFEWRGYDAVLDTDVSTLSGAILDDASDCSVSLGAMVATAERAVATEIARCQPDVGDDGRMTDVTGKGSRRERARRKRELEVWSVDMAAPRCGLDFSSGQQTLLGAGINLAAAITADDVRALHDASVPRARALQGCMLRLSHTDGTPAAYRATVPPVPLVRVAASWLAWRAVVAYPLLGGRYSAAPHRISGPLSLTWTAGCWTWRSRITRDKYGYGSMSPAEPIRCAAGSKTSGTVPGQAPYQAGG